MGKSKGNVFQTKELYYIINFYIFNFTPQAGRSSVDSPPGSSEKSISTPPSEDMSHSKSAGIGTWLEMENDGLYREPLFIESGDANFKPGWMETLVFGNNEDKKSQLLLLKNVIDSRLKEVTKIHTDQCLEH